jgi:hypothetical protein
LSVFSSLGTDFKKQGKLAKELLTGKDGVEKAFLSTGVGDSFGGAVKMEIFVPKGTQAIYAAPFSKFGGNGSKWDGIKGIKDFSKSESEILVNCGYKMRITGVEYTKKSLGWELNLKLEIIGH